MSGCGPAGLAAPGLETAIAGTFANLYVLQQVEQGHPAPPRAGVQPRASCQKGTPADVQAGAGNDWVCRITFLVDGPATPVTALYNVTLQPDGCYSADGDGPASVNGSRTVAGADGRPRVNPLWLVDGCTDPG